METVRVLLADDHAVVRAGIRKTVEEIPGLFVVGEVENGAQIFEALQREAVDCLLMDVTMPEFDPIKAILKIKSLYPRLKILVVSAFDDDIYVQGLLGAGVNGYHMKDQPLNDLKLAIQRVLAGERWISSSLIGKLVAPPPMVGGFPLLTERQHTLLQFLKDGLDNQSIAQEMGLSIKTVENHLTRLYRQLGVQSRLEAVNYSSRYPQVLGRLGMDAALQEARPAAGARQHLNVLVVDDNIRYRKQLQRMIGKLCPWATLFEAENIHGMLETGQKIELHIALVDVVLGDEDGITCTRRLKAILPQCRVILISAYPDREFHRQGLQAGAVAFLDKKDLDLATLRQVLDDIVH